MQQGTLQENENARKIVSLPMVLENKGRKKGSGFRSLHLVHKEDGQNRVKRIKFLCSINDHFPCVLSSRWQYK